MLGGSGSFCLGRHYTRRHAPRGACPMPCLRPACCSQGLPQVCYMGAVCMQQQLHLLRALRYHWLDAWLNLWLNS